MTSKSMGLRLIIFGLVVAKLLSTPVLALASCGNINTIDSFGEAVSTPIDNCEDPFDAADSVSFSATLSLAGQAVTDGSELAIATTSQVTGSYEIDKDFNFAFSPFQLFQKQGDDLLQITAPREVDFTLEALPAGEYMAVFTYEEAPILSDAADGWWQRFITWLLPSPALASPGPGPGFGKEVLVWEFVVTEPVVEPPPPTGASSVLFLPGIQASRLYTDGVLGSENRLWEPNRDNDVEKLAMDETGQSINDIYTRDVLDEIFGIRNVYRGFLNQLNDLQTGGSIVDFEPFAYDWRYDVFTVATEPVRYPNGEEKLLLDEVKRLASESYTGKVTIVGHSNGGLVAKALMAAYQDNELDGLVEKVIMVGTPQLGTPKAVGSILHGYDQALAFEFLVTQNTARESTRYMPGAYGLVPSRTYFESIDSEIITTDGSSLAVPVSSYDDLRTYDNFIDFLLDAKGTRSDVSNLTQPITLRESLLEQTVLNQTDLDAWVAPDDVQVFEVVGTGLPTIDGFSYREFGCKESNAFCALNPFLKPVPEFTFQGDGTVVMSSAAAYERDKIKYIVDLYEEGLQFLKSEKEHADILESESVAAFMESSLLYPQLTDTLVGQEFDSISESFTIIGVHSPVSILVKNSKGEFIGEKNNNIKEEIIGSDYFEFAESKYVVVPTSEDIEVLLTGQAEGRYSLTIESLTPNDEQTLVQELLGATSTAGMVGSFVCHDGVCGNVSVDYNKDGTIDVQFDWDGNYVDLTQPDEIPDVITPDESRSASTGTRVRQPSNQPGQVAGAATTISDEDLQRMWAQVLEIKLLLEEIESRIMIREIKTVTL